MSPALRSMSKNRIFQNKSNNASKIKYVGIFILNLCNKKIEVESFEGFLRQLENVKVIDASIGYWQYTPIDLSPENEKLSSLANAREFENYVETILGENNAKVGYGGYLEKRNLYQRSAIFNLANRNIHIGLDLWTHAGTEVLAAADGIVHSFKNNKGLGNYGPTVILEHAIENCIFYTLYGHLSVGSLANLEVGKRFSKGENIATLGDSSVNGDYAPHLHFQIIKDIQGNFGDYPGVCSATNLEFYKQNCPDPNLLLKINHDEKTIARP